MLGDDFVLSCRYGDGSLATLTYASIGNRDAGKERIECLWDGRTAVLDDYRKLEVHGVTGADRTWDRVDKGHAELLRRFLEHCAGRESEPISWAECLDASRLVLELDSALRGSDPSV